MLGGITTLYYSLNIVCCDFIEAHQKASSDLVMSCYFHGLQLFGRVMSADTDSCGALLRPVGEHMMFGGSIKRTQ